MSAGAAILAIPTLNGVTATPPPVNGGVTFKAKAVGRATATQKLPGISIGGTVKTLTNASVRSTPAGVLMGSHPVGTTGTVTAGPTPMPAKPDILDNVATNWWNITFNSGVSGWLGEVVLAAMSTPPPPPPTTYLAWIEALSAAAPGLTIAQVSKWIASNPPKSD